MEYDTLSDRYARFLLDEILPEVEKTVKLRLAGEDREMVRGDDGWWRLSVPSAGPGTSYGFVVSGQDDALPDPR